MLEITSLTVSISKLRHYTNFSDQPPLSQYPGSASADCLLSRDCEDDFRKGGFINISFQQQQSFSFFLTQKIITIHHSSFPITL